MIKACINLAINSIRILLIKNKRRITDLNYIFLLACYELLKSCDLDPQPSANIATKKTSSDIESRQVDDNGENIAPNTIDIDTSEINKGDYICGGPSYTKRWQIWKESKKKKVNFPREEDANENIAPDKKNINKSEIDKRKLLCGMSYYSACGKRELVKFFKSQKNSALQSVAKKLAEGWSVTKVFTDNYIMHKIVTNGDFSALVKSKDFATEKDASDNLFYNIRQSIGAKDFEDLINQEDDEGNTPLYLSMKDKPNIMMLNELSNRAVKPENQLPETQFLHVNKKGETFLHLSIKCGSKYVEKCLSASVMSYKLQDKDITYKDYYINKKRNDGKSALDICLDLMNSDFDILNDTIKYIHNTKQSFLKDLYKTLTLLIKCGARYDKQKLSADLDNLAHSMPEEEIEITNLITLQQPNINILPSFDNNGFNQNQEWNCSGGLPSYEDFNILIEPL